MLRSGLEPWHLLVVLAVIVLLFGSKKLPEMARGLGKSMRILKAETKALREDDVPAEGSVTKDVPASPAEQPRPAPVTASNITALDENSRSADTS